jgi:trehalose 6-phosphate synthase/phosphatase
MIKEPQFKRLVIAAYRLPFKFEEQNKGYKAVQNAGGLVSAVLALSENSKKNKTSLTESKIAWAGLADNLPANISPAQLNNKSFDIIPVTMPSEINDLYYGGFCNDLIWPLFHYFSEFSVFNVEYYHAYQEANALFCKTLVRHIRKGDFVWIHDYQLMLLPEMIRNSVEDVTIGFFLHIPFPSFEIFRLLPRDWRESIITGMLGADLIGFHTHDYTQHFIKTVKRTTGFECRQNLIYTPNKVVKADAFPIGIDYHKFHAAGLTKIVLAEKQKISESLHHQKLIFSVDRLDYSKGLLSKLRGYEKFLEDNPKWHSKVVFNMVVVPSRDSIDQYRQMKTDIESMVGRINGKYSSLAWRPIIYQYKSLNFNELVALYDLSDVGLITPLRDGMNLVAKEFVACQTRMNGVLILSEMAGAAVEMNEALIINPADNIEMAKAIEDALEMKPAEKEVRMARMQERISNYNVFTWADDFFSQTFDIKEHQKLLEIKHLTAATQSRLIADYKKASRRILFLDYDGTLVSLTKYPEQAVIGKQTLKIIKDLAAVEKNEIVIISGRGKAFLEKQFKGVRVSLVAEHGYFTKKPGRKWIAVYEPDERWKEAVRPILMEYVNRCYGTFIEEKTGSMAWHYRNADSDFALLRLNELKDDLANIIRYKTDFEILEGNKILEIKSGRYDKGQAAISLLQNENFDFILAAGDDITDEDVFRILPEKAYTIRVGLKPSAAGYNVKEISVLLKLLKSLGESREDT